MTAITLNQYICNHLNGLISDCEKGIQVFEETLAMVTLPASMAHLTRNEINAELVECQTAHSIASTVVGQLQDESFSPDSSVEHLHKLIEDAYKNRFVNHILVNEATKLIVYIGTIRNNWNELGKGV